MYTFINNCSISLLTFALIIGVTGCRIDTSSKHKSVLERRRIAPSQKSKKKSIEERRLFSEARNLHEFYRQANPQTGTISRLEKQRENTAALRAPINNGRLGILNVVSRGPDNLGGRTRSLVFDRADLTGNTIIAGAVSGGVFKTTNGGVSWTKVSAADDIHNVTTIIQDPRTGFENTWYYGTGEGLGNSASKSAAFYFGRGIWQSTDNGDTWTQINSTNSTQNSFDSRFDIINKVAINPVTGELFAAITGSIVRYDGTTWTTEVSSASAGSSTLTDIVFTNTGRAYAAFSSNCSAASRGVWTSATGNGGWSKIADNGTPTGWNQNTANGRCVLAIAPSNNNLLYALYVNTSTGSIEADLWRWSQSGTSWSNFSSKLPDETGGSPGNDPFAVQGGYDLVVSVKPDNPNFVVIGGTNCYKIADITTDPTFERIGGYTNPNSYGLWNVGGVNHHPDIHALIFNPFDNEELFSGSDGGIHSTGSISATSASSTVWTSLNNNYQSYQFYHVAIDPQSGSDIIIGGAQDNGTTSGGTGLGLPNTTNHSAVFSGDGAACAVSRDDPCVPFFMTSQNGNIVRDCPTYATITPTGSNSEFVTYFYMDPDNNETIYYAGEDRIYRTNNSSTVTSGAWTDIGGSASLGHTDFFQTFATTRGAYNTASSYLMTGGDQGHIYRLDDPKNNNLTSAVDITPAAASTTFPSIVSDIAIHPTNPDIAMAVYSNYGIPSIFITTNATAAVPTWSLGEQNLSDHSIRSATIASVSGTTYYIVGTARGIYTNEDPVNNNWSRESTTDIGFALISSMSYRPSDNKLLIGTHGNGMFEATVQNPGLSYDALILSGEAQQDHILLKWYTENEKSNKYFNLQASKDGIAYTTIAQVESLGDSYERQEYTFKDNRNIAGSKAQYYRIETVENNGNKILSNSIAITTRNLPDQNLTLSPNPVKDILYLTYNTDNQNPVRIFVTNMKGQIVSSKTLTTPNYQINTTDWSPGLYLVNVTRNGQNIIQKKIVKE